METVTFTLQQFANDQLPVRLPTDEDPISSLCFHGLGLGASNPDPRNVFREEEGLRGRSVGHEPWLGENEWKRLKL